MFRFADGFNTLNVSLEAWNKSDYFVFSPYTPKKSKKVQRYLNSLTSFLLLFLFVIIFVTLSR